jgi:hypothetical protein
MRCWTCFFAAAVLTLAKLGRQHIARTGNVAREVWKLMEQEETDKAKFG